MSEASNVVTSVMQQSRQSSTVSDSDTRLGTAGCAVHVSRVLSGVCVVIVELGCIDNHTCVCVCL